MLALTYRARYFCRDSEPLPPFTSRLCVQEDLAERIAEESKCVCVGGARCTQGRPSVLAFFLRQSGGKVARASWAGAVGKTLQGSKIVRLCRG